ncbi:temperature dependent protein affecting M2 dsRNA replication [Syncephalis plumigaleata]|nr:temperature dependent protein affecting M2 dsRNA replication [Syncephalis plumigaleata]
METKEEILANVLFRTLEHRNIYGRALLQACSLSAKSKTINYSHQSELFLAIELLRLGVLHGNPFSKTYGVANAAIADKDKPSILLIARAFTLVQMSHQSVPWVGPLSRELLAFNSFSKSLGRSLRTLCESLLLNSFITGQVKRDRSDFAELNLNLPFGTDANTGLGILVKVYLEQIKTKPSGTAANKAMEEALKHVEETFTGCQNVKDELGRGFRFWDQLMAAIKILKTENAIDNNVYQQFIKTNQWLSPCRF